jgi:SnoaL-like domain
MTLNLAEPIAAYFAAERSGPEAVVRCFTNDAVVKDEDETYKGLDAIRRWRQEAAAKYAYTCKPLHSEQANTKTIVTCRLEGTFPGSPIDLRFIFGLERGKIASLEIKV